MGRENMFDLFGFTRESFLWEENRLRKYTAARNGTKLVQYLY